MFSREGCLAFIGVYVIYNEQFEANFGVLSP